MVLSPGAGRASAARGAVLCPSRAAPEQGWRITRWRRGLPRLVCSTCRSRPRRGGEGQGSTPKAGVGRRQRGKTTPRSRALQKNFQKPLTEAAQYDIIAKRCQDSGKGHGGVAQLARATGSYPVGHRFKSGLRYHIGQGSAVPYPSGTALVRGFPPGPLVKRPKTPPFHGGNSSSNLLRVTK